MPKSERSRPSAWRQFTTMSLLLLACSTGCTPSVRTVALRPPALTAPEAPPLPEPVGTDAEGASVYDPVDVADYLAETSIALGVCRATVMSLQEWAAGLPGAGQNE